MALRNPLYISRMRVWLVLLLTLSFSLQGWASARAAGTPCLMGEEAAEFVSQAFERVEPQGSETMVATIALDAEGDDCCNDMATFLKTGQACKTGQDCHSTAVALPVGPHAEAGLSQAAPSVLSSTAPQAVLVAVWRPPTSI